jgi:hypothetical protein
MNIFVLDNNPIHCARYHCDKHVVKMILESAQMICTTHATNKNKNLNYTIPYKPTHMNHPCTKWVRDSLGNYLWLMELTKALNDEYRYRYNKDVDHKSWSAIKDLPLPNINNIGRTSWARAMPIECKIDNTGQRDTDVIESYRNYYSTHKKDILFYTKRDQPSWLSLGAY